MDMSEYEQWIEYLQFAEFAIGMVGLLTCLVLLVVTPGDRDKLVKSLGLNEEEGQLETVTQNQPQKSERRKDRRKDGNRRRNQQLAKASKSSTDSHFQNSDYQGQDSTKTGDDMVTTSEEGGELDEHAVDSTFSSYTLAGLFFLALIVLQLYATSLKMGLTSLSNDMEECVPPSSDMVGGTNQYQHGSTSPKPTVAMIVKSYEQIGRYQDYARNAWQMYENEAFNEGFDVTSLRTCDQQNRYSQVRDPNLLEAIKAAVLELELEENDRKYLEQTLMCHPMEKRLQLIDKLQDMGIDDSRKIIKDMQRAHRRQIDLREKGHSIEESFLMCFTQKLKGRFKQSLLETHRGMSEEGLDFAMTVAEEEDALEGIASELSYWFRWMRPIALVSRDAS